MTLREYQQIVNICFARSKEETSPRNADIYKIYEEGTSVKSLSEIYYLSTKSIQKIIFRMKKENQ